MPTGLRSVLYCTFDYILHPGYATGEASWREMYPVIGGQSLRVVRAPGAAGGMRESATNGYDVWG
jgi:hypothetical protein